MVATSGKKGHNMIVTQYSQDDSYLSQEDYDNLEPEEKKYREPNSYDEDLDQTYYDIFKYKVKQAFAKRNFPLVLEAIASNWQNQTGYATCVDVDDVLQKVNSFDSGSIELHRGKGNALWFQMGGTHDVPHPFTIKVNTI